MPAGKTKTSTDKVEETPKKSKTTSTTKELVEGGFIYIEKGITKNMKDFNSARVTVGLTLPIGFSDEQLKQAKEEAQVVIEVVDKILQNEVDGLNL